MIPHNIESFPTTWADDRPTKWAAAAKPPTRRAEALVQIRVSRPCSRFPPIRRASSNHSNQQSTLVSSSCQTTKSLLCSPRLSSPSLFPSLLSSPPLFSSTKQLLQSVSSMPSRTYISILSSPLLSFSTPLHHLTSRIRERKLLAPDAGACKTSGWMASFDFPAGPLSALQQLPCAPRQPTSRLSLRSLTVHHCASHHSRPYGHPSKSQPSGEPTVRSRTMANSTTTLYRDGRR